MSIAATDKNYIKDISQLKKLWKNGKTDQYAAFRQKLKEVEEKWQMDVVAVIRSMCD